MALPEFCVAIWLLPHKGVGYFAEIDADLMADALPGGTFQSAADVEVGQNRRELNPNSPYREFHVTTEKLLSLIQLADQAVYSFAEHPYTPRTSGSKFGTGYPVASKWPKSSGMAPSKTKMTQFDASMRPLLLLPGPNPSVKGTACAKAQAAPYLER